MDCTKIAFADTQQFDNIFLDYIAARPALAPFYHLSPQIENFPQQIALKQDFPQAHRTVLHEALQKQYEHLSRKPQLSIDLLLQPNTFTLTTGHQLNIFTGPLYFHFKILTVIKAARELRAKYPQYNFVPVYWMASEDHDFEEISSFHLFHKKYTWLSDQKGAVGRFAPQSLSEVIAQTPEMDSLFLKAYEQNATLAEATRDIINELYGHDGLIVIDGDDRRLKGLFAPILKEELLQQPTLAQINHQNEALTALGYRTQVFPRPINLFYLDHNLRERIVREGEQYKVLNTDLAFSEAEILQIVAESPEKFSPNVALRPLYQELILPNLSYTGGPGEFAYWLQLKGVFEHFGLPFPILLPRNFGMIIPKHLSQKMEKLGISPQDLFQPTEQLRSQWLGKHMSEPIELEAEKAKLQELFDQITHKAVSLDKSLAGMIGAMQQKSQQTIEQIEHKIQKAQQQKYDTELLQLADLHQKLCPNGGLQERKDNFLNFYLNDKEVLHRLMHSFEPFDFRFHIFRLE